jgi:hemerythrin-like domain-containing protein
MSNTSAIAGQVPGDILDVLRRDHLRIDHLLDQIEATEDSEERRRAQLFAQVAAEIEVHSDAEDQVVYLALESRAGFEDFIEESRQEHEHIEQMLEELDLLEARDPGWLAKVRELRQLVRHHVDQEEGILFAKIRDALSTEERHRLEGEFLAARDSEEEEVSAERAITQPFQADGARDIASLTRRELYELARSRQIEGRSAMTKEELVAAIRATPPGVRRH